MGIVSIRQFNANVSAAFAKVETGATILLSENMHHGLGVDGLTIVNPFVAANESVLADWLGSAA